MYIREPHFLLPEYHASARTVLGASGIAHVAGLLILAALFWFLPRDRDTETQRLSLNLVYIPQPGAHSGGGGGGGSRSLAPPRTTSTPKVKPPDPLPTPTPRPEPVPEAQPAAELPVVAAQQAMAVLGPVASLTSESRGPGDGRGADDGRGPGVGPGDGPGAGPGQGPGVGGERVFAIGNGVTSPLLLSKVRPRYTAEAMLRRIQGEARLSCVVLKTGFVGDCEIAQSLDQDRYGLDSEAFRAARQFQFRPATQAGDPVPVRVIIVLEFNMR